MKSRFLISIVDDDESVRESLESLLRSVGYRVSLFGGAEEFIAADVIDQTDCLILDFRLGGMSGPELQRELTARGRSLPIVFITAHGTAPLRQRVLDAGAVACLQKPYSEKKLLAAVEAAVGLEPRINLD